MSRNPENVATVLLSGADHAPIDEYLRHGLVDAMQRVVRRFGTQETPVGDVVYGRRTHSLKIVVDGLVGKGTFVARRRGCQRMTFHVEDLTSPSAEVQVFAKGVMRRHYRLKAGKEATVTFTGRVRQVRLLATSRYQRGEIVVSVDYDSPTFDGIQVSPSLRHPGRFALLAEGARDDGNWSTSDYRIHATIDGRDLPPRPGISVEVESLPPGAHTAILCVQDGAGRFSETRTVQLVADSQPPSPTFLSPGANATVRRGRQLGITIEAGDPEGIMRASVYPGRVSEDEFNYTRLWVFPGPFGADRPARRTCRVPANWSSGQHLLIAVVVDNSGQQTRVERVFRVQ